MIILIRSMSDKATDDFHMVMTMMMTMIMILMTMILFISLIIMIKCVMILIQSPSTLPTFCPRLSDEVTDNYHKDISGDNI